MRRRRLRGGVGRHRHRLAGRGRASRLEARRARLCPRARGRLRPRPDQRRRERHPQVRPRRPRPPRRGLVADRQRLARGLSRQRRPADRRPHPGRISHAATSPPAPASPSPTTVSPTAAAPARPCSSSAPPSGCSTTSSSWTARPRFRSARRRASTSRPATGFSARYAVTSDIQLVGAYEIADGEAVDARTARLGFDLQPWAGARIARQRQCPGHRRIWPAQLRRLRPVPVAGARQALVGRCLGRRQQDSGRDRPGPSPQPAPSGRQRRLHRRRGGTLTEDFTALTAGATYRAGDGASPAAPNIAPATRATATASPPRRFARSATARRSAARSTGSSPRRRTAPRPAPPTSS